MTTEQPALDTTDEGSDGPEFDTLDRSLVRNRLRSRLFGTDERGITLGRFVLLEQIGSGGMGRVYAAWDEQLARRVALKILRDDSHSVARTRILREAQAQARVSHPNVVPIYEAGVDDDRVWLAMEFVEGVTLSEWSRAAGRDWRAVLAVLIAAGRGLCAAHEVGLVHRDFKPANVMVGGDERPRVLDFGLARGLGDSSLASMHGSIDELGSISASGSNPQLSLLDHSLTLHGNLVGTPAYMAPEQLAGAGVDALSDQFSFCVTAFECLFGQRPFGGRSFDELSSNILTGQVQPIPRGTKVPARVSAVLLRGLSGAPHERWPSMAELLDELERATGREQYWRRWSLGLAGLTIGIALGAAVIEQPSSCTIDASALAGVWDDVRREQLSEAFVATRVGGAADSAKVIASRLDQWSSAWLAAQREACEATELRATQSQQVLDRRRTCFARHQRQARLVVDGLIAAERPVVANPAELLEQLPDPQLCDVAHLDDAAALPSDERARAEILQGYEQLAAARVALGSGAPERAAELLDALTDVAARHPPLALERELVIAHRHALAGRTVTVVEVLQPAIARAVELGLVELEAELRVGVVRHAVGAWSVPEAEQLLIDEASLALRRIGDPDDARWLDIELGRAELAESLGRYDEATDTLGRALELALEHDRDPTQLLVLLGNTARKRNDAAQARQAYDRAEAAVRERWGANAPQLPLIAYNRGLLALDHGELDVAEQQLTSARARDVELWGEDALVVAQSDFALAKLAQQRGELERGLELCERAEPVFVRTLGPDHEETGYLLNALGVFRYFAGDYAGSLDAYERALAIGMRTLGKDHEQVGLLHSNIGESLLELGRMREAGEAFEQAVRVLERLSPDDGHPLLALPLKGRALALLDQGSLDAAARELERALAILERDEREPLELAATRFALARALSDRDRARARELAELAAADYERLTRAADAASVRTWLDER